MRDRSTLSMISVGRIGAVALMTLLPITALAYLGPLPPEPDRLWFTLLPDGPFVNGGDFSNTLKCSMDYDRDSNEYVLEVRDSKTMQSITAAPLPSVDRRSAGRFVPKLTEDAFQTLERQRHPFAKLGAGKYVCAVMLHGERISNVAEIEIDPDFDLTKRPVLELIPIEAAPYSGLPSIGVRVNGSDLLDEPFRCSTVFDASIDVDGVPRSNTISIWGGLNPEIVKGTRRSFIRPIDGFLSPEIEPNIAHTARLKFMTYASNEIELKPERTLGERWDQAKVIDE